MKSCSGLYSSYVHLNQHSIYCVLAGFVVDKKTIHISTSLSALKFTEPVQYLSDGRGGWWHGEQNLTYAEIRSIIVRLLWHLTSSFVMSAWSGGSRRLSCCGIRGRFGWGLRIGETRNQEMALTIRGMYSSGSYILWHILWHILFQILSHVKHTEWDLTILNSSKHIF